MRGDEEGSQKPSHGSHEQEERQLPDVVEVALAVERDVIVVQPGNCVAFVDRLGCKVSLEDV